MHRFIRVMVFGNVISKIPSWYCANNPTPALSMKTLCRASFKRPYAKHPRRIANGLHDYCGTPRAYQTEDRMSIKEKRQYGQSTPRQDCQLDALKNVQSRKTSHSPATSEATPAQREKRRRLAFPPMVQPRQPWARQPRQKIQRKPITLMVVHSARCLTGGKGELHNRWTNLRLYRWIKD